MEFKLIVELDTNKHQKGTQPCDREHPDLTSVSDVNSQPLGHPPRRAAAQQTHIPQALSDKWDWICVALTILCLWQIASPSPPTAPKSGTFTSSSSALKTVPNKYTGKPIFPLGGKTLATTRITDLPGSPRPNNRIHAGIDLAAYQDDVVAVLPGTIVELKPDSGVGGIIGIESNWKGKKVKLRYVHLEREPLRSFSLGQKIQAGQKLSYIKSNFPGSSGPHLHLEVYINGELQWRLQDFLKLAVVNR
ncbi:MULTISPECIES: M23 family metallopeptidase [Oscillatoriales]|uniref:peptidoglycan DD-metalloendopeptidase family protein n=1 Tax=Planktothrix sp. FACHB-1355 TaxID=2692854 RepID=UPI0016830007